jgi:hypothetical protein
MQSAFAAEFGSARKPGLPNPEDHFIFPSFSVSRLQVAPLRQFCELNVQGLLAHSGAKVMVTFGKRFEIV